MPRGHRLLIIAALVFVAIYGFGLGYYHAALNYAEEEPYQLYRAAGDDIANIDPSLARSDRAELLEYRLPCREPKGRDESDLCAQWRAAKAGENSAFWAKWGTVIATVGSALLLWQIALTRTAVEDTSLANKTMREANEIASTGARAWLSVEITSDGKLTPYESLGSGFGYGLQVDAKIINHGPAPANDVRFNCEAVVPRKGDDMDSPMKIFCDDWRSRLNNTEYSGGIAIFSQQCGDAAHGIFFTDSEIMGQMNDMGVPFVSLSLVGCVSYKTPHANGVRQTRFHAHLSQVPGRSIEANSPDWWRTPLKIIGPMYIQAD